MALVQATFLALLPEFGSIGSSSVGTVEWLGSGSFGDTIAVGGLEFAGVTGARVAGSLTWSVDGSTSAQAASFTAMVNDSEAADVLTVARLTPTTVELTTIAKGPRSELYFATSAPLVYSLSGATLEGGSALLAFELANAVSMVNEAVWKTKASAGQAYLCAHLIAVSTGKAGGELGVATSRGISAISQGNASTSFDPKDAAFASSKWGRKYLALRSTLFVLGAATGARG